MELDPDRPVRIGVVADTHSRPHPRAVDHLVALAPACILHAGDIGRMEVVDALAEVAPTIAVRGNIDPRGLADEIDLTVTVGGGARLRIFLTHIAVVGPRLRADVGRRARACAADLVVCGHSHVPLVAREGRVTVFNPGSIGPRRFHLPITFGVIELGDGGVSLRHVDCETGGAWAPPPSVPRGTGAR